MRFGYTIGRKMRDPKIVIGNIGNSLYSKRKTNGWKFRIYIYVCVFRTGQVEEEKGRRNRFTDFRRGGATLAQQLETRWKMRRFGRVDIFFRSTSAI